jgi:hypothetical protein
MESPVIEGEFLGVQPRSDDVFVDAAESVGRGGIVCSIRVWGVCCIPLDTSSHWGPTMGHNRGGDNARAKLKRRRREEARLASKAASTKAAPKKK